MAVLAVLASPPAQAMPGDPEIVNLAPGEFQSTSLVHDDLAVTFSCPAYRTGAAGMIADGDASDYSVRLAMGNTGPDRRLPGPGSPEFFSETAAQPIPGSTNCTAQLPMTRRWGPPSLFFGGVDWQVARRCPGCNGGWEPGPVGWVILKPAIEGLALTIPAHVYAGYLTRFSFATTSDLSGATISLQDMTRKGWTNLGQTPFAPGAESVFFAKLPAGHTLLRINLTAGLGGVLQMGTPYEEVTVLKPGGRRTTGPRDDGIYLAFPPADPPLNFKVVGDGRRLRRLQASIPVSCQSSVPTGSTITARLRSARIAPDGTVVGRTLMPGATPTYVTLDGKVRHGHFEGTVTAAFGDCSGSSDFEAGMITATSADGAGTLR
jgi:hypothetical protein